MTCVFDNPEHANGGCIFADPSQPLLEQAFLGIMKAIMMDIMTDIESAGGCCE